MDKPAASAHVKIKTLTPDDWEAYRDLWLEALQEEQWAFSISLENKRDSFTEAKWRKSCATPHKAQSFMLMDGNQPVGVASVKISKRDPGGKTVVLLRNYIRRAYRGRGLSGYLYRARFQWALAEQFAYAESAYRRSNSVSQKAGQKWGLTHSRTETGRIFNGEPDDVLYYTVPLADLTERLAELDRTDPIPFC